MVICVGLRHPITRVNPPLRSSSSPLVSSARLAYLAHLTGCFTNLTRFSIYVLFYH